MQFQSFFDPDLKYSLKVLSSLVTAVKVQSFKFCCPVIGSGLQKIIFIS